jgi:hypothetical protein
MASTPSKLSSSHKPNAIARSLSQTRLVAAKSTGKAAKIAVAKNVRQAPTSSPPSGIAKAARSVKSHPGGAVVVGLPSETSGVRAIAVEDRASGASASKNELKAKFTKLSAVTSQIAGLKRSIGKTFFEIGALLNQIRDERLYEVKGYGSFESFVEREIDINKVTCLRVARAAEALNRAQAVAAGLDRSLAAVAALDGEIEMAAVARPLGSPAGGVPLHKQ